MSKKQIIQKKRSKGSIIFLLIIISLLGVVLYGSLNGLLGSKDKTYDYQGNYESLKIDLSHDLDNAITNIKFTPISGDSNDGQYEVTGNYSVDNEKCEVIEGEKTCYNTFYLKIGTEHEKEQLIEAIAANTRVIPIDYVTLSDFNFFATILSFLPIIIMIIFFVMIMKSSGGGSKAMDFGASKAKLSTGTKVKFKDIAGNDEEKYEMEELIDFLKYPAKYKELGARIPKGVLLSGPPGTGKTLMAKAIAGEANVPFFSISGSDFLEMYVGVGASRVRNMFKVAKQNSPCIIFIDEIDAVGRQRGAGVGGGHDEREQTLNQLLTEMDGFESHTGVIMIAATNRPDILDPALLRPGRFDRQIIISNPDVRGREAILKVHSKNKKLKDGTHLSDIAKRTPGFSGADLENLLNEAALLAARENRKSISIQDIDEAVDRVLMGPAKKSRKYSTKERSLVAHHEAGHVVIGLKLDNAEVVQKVTIIPRGQAGGYALMLPEEETFLETKTSLLDRITGLLGGRVAEDIIFNEISTGAHNDFQKATSIARAMVTEYGMSSLGPVQYEQQAGSVFLGRDYQKKQNFSDAVALEIDKEVRAIVEECYKRATKVLNDHLKLLKDIAEYLLKIETLTKDDILEIANEGTVTWWEEQNKKDLEKAEAETKVEESSETEDTSSTEESTDTTNE